MGKFLSLQERGIIYRVLCPFHQGKTPSFTITPNRSMFCCFGYHKGGNAITFLTEHENMTYLEAVKWLDRRCGIEVEERRETIDERQQRPKHESLLIVSATVHRHYRGMFLRYKPAQDYTYCRWGQKYCDEIEIGSAPTGDKVFIHLPLQKEFLQGLGLTNKQGHGFSQDRIVILIKNRYQHVISLTAGVMDDSQPEYLDNKESSLCNKRNTVFGLDVTWRAAGKTEQIYLVGGAPDCIRLHTIGAQNTVANLGSTWTVEQFQLIKRTASKICFIPDDDPPKGGADCGAGIKAVIKAGKPATEQHLIVSVKEIPITRESKRGDPDTYFRNQTLFKVIEEGNFILRLATRLFETSSNTEQKSDAVKQIAHLLSFIDDDTRLTMFIDALTEYRQGKLFWQKAVENERTRRGNLKEDEIDLNRQYGFWIDHGKYFSTTEEGGVIEWSNFMLAPLFHIEDPLMAKQLFLLTNELGIKEVIEMEQEDLISLQRFRQKLESLSNFIWKADEKKLVKLKCFLYEKTETTAQVKQLGWNKKGFCTFGNDIYYGDKFGKVSEYGTVHLDEKGNCYLPAFSQIYKENTDYLRFEYQFVRFNFSMILLRDFTRQLFLVFGDNGKIGFCFYPATLFRDIIALTTHSFPILDLLGPKGFGKNELGHTLMSFFVTGNIPPNIQNSTIPALDDTVVAAANTLVHIDEYKNGIDTTKIEFIKGLWSGTGRARMNMAADKKKGATAVDAGVIISGQEVPTTDIVLLSRFIFLSFPKSDFTDDEKRNYQRLFMIRSEGMTYLTLQLLTYRELFVKAFYDQYHLILNDVNKRLGSGDIIDRIVQNWVVPFTAFQCLEGKLDLSLSCSKVLNIMVESIIHQNTECKASDELSSFWRMVQLLNNEGGIYEDADFRVKTVSRFHSSTISETKWVEPHKILYLQKTRIFMLYKLNAHHSGEALLPEESLHYYLENGKEYLGKQHVTYRIVKGDNQILDFDHRDAKGQPTGISVQRRSYRFGCEKLVRAFDVNLEIAREENNS